MYALIAEPLANPGRGTAAVDNAHREGVQDAVLTTLRR
jgi:hypothetical protein